MGREQKGKQQSIMTGLGFITEDAIALQLNK